MAGVSVYGAEWCGDCKRATAVLDRLQIKYTYDTEGDGRLMAIMVIAIIFVAIMIIIIIATMVMTIKVIAITAMAIMANG